MRLADVVARSLATADVHIGGTRPWDIQVHRPSLYARVMRRGSIALGESYVEGWWDVQRLDEFFTRLLRAGLDRKRDTAWSELRRAAGSRLWNLQGRVQAHRNSRHHYDHDLSFYQAMLDRRMVYSCAYWSHASTLEEAQEAKLDLVCRKLELQPGMSLLDIGCGWGGFARYAAERYGARVVGITVSKPQSEYARDVCQNLPVDIRCTDYRDLTGTYDRIVSIGMFEHVGVRNHRRFMEIVSRCLRNDGVFLLQTIGGNESVRFIDPWIDKYIFPGAMLPSVEQLSAASGDLMVMEDWHNFGSDYDRTLMEWFDNLERHQAWVRSHQGEHFFRMWKYYLLSCAATFRARRNHVWQVLYSKHRSGGLRVPR